MQRGGACNDLLCRRPTLPHYSDAPAGGGGGGRGEGLSPTQSGYLGYLLHMGHLHGLLDQVEGMAGSCDGRLGGGR